MRCTISFEVFLAHSKATNIITRSSLSQLFLYLIHSISGHNFSDAFAHYIVALFRSHFVVFVPKIFRHRNVCCATAHISLSLIHFSFLVCLVSFFIVSSLCSLFRCFDICLGVCVCAASILIKLCICRSCQFHAYVVPTSNRLWRTTCGCTAFNWKFVYFAFRCCTLSTCFN